jgi:uncharacterized protein (TIGR01777 family)
MHILITGASGFIARNLVVYLVDQIPDIKVTLLTRKLKRTTSLYSKIRSSALELALQQGRVLIVDHLDENILTPDVVINLAGSPIVTPQSFTLSNDDLHSSRIKYTKKLCKTLKELKKFPKVFMNASAMGIYGSPKAECDENTVTLGGDFIANLALDWESSVYEGAKLVASRIVLLRFSNVLGSGSGFIKNSVPVIRQGFGDIRGSDKQYMPWIGIEDTVRAIHHCIVNSSIKGPVNICTPNKYTYHDYCNIVSEIVGKKQWFKCPRFIVLLAKGKIAPCFLNSLIMIPKKLEDTGFKFKDVELETLLPRFIKDNSNKIK